MYERTGSSDRLSIEESHFFDQIGLAFDVIMDHFRDLRGQTLAEEGGDFRRPSTRGILWPAKIGPAAGADLCLFATGGKNLRRGKAADPQNRSALGTVCSKKNK